MPNNIIAALPLSSRGRHGTGFTILELLIAMMIFAIVVSLVFGSFHSVFSSADHVNTSSDIFEMGNNCLSLINRDLQSIHVSLYPRYRPPISAMDDRPDIYRFIGGQDLVSGDGFATLRFTSLNHLPIGQGIAEGIAEIVYYPQETENGGIVLKRSDTLFPYPDFEKRETDPVMCENVLAFELTYYDHENREFQEWDSQDEDYLHSTPLSVGIKLVIGTLDQQYEFTLEAFLPMHRYQDFRR